jgi:DNA-binding NarL/FixJ family response regulator
LTGCSDANCSAEALAAGGSAVVPKTSPAAQLVMAIQEALNGGAIARQGRKRIVEFPQRGAPEPVAPSNLSPREMEVLQLISQGRRTKEAACILSVSPRTVECHRYRITTKLGIRTTAELTKYAMRHGVVPA